MDAPFGSELGDRPKPLRPRQRVSSEVMGVHVLRRPLPGLETGAAGSGTKVRLPPFHVLLPMPLADDHRIRVEMEPPKLPWPIVFFFTEAIGDAGESVFVCEGAEHGAVVGLEQDGAAADSTIQAADHYREHVLDYQRMAECLCRPYIRENRRRAAEIYAARILRWRRMRRTEADRLRVRDKYREYVARKGRRYGAITAIMAELYYNDRKAVRRALDDCVRHGEMEASELSPSRRRAVTAPR